MIRTLPQPKLTQSGLEWLVAYGHDGGMRAAFSEVSAAVNFACSCEEQGFRRVTLGHTVFGWLDTLDLRRPSGELIPLVAAWAQGFRSEPWHAARYDLAVARGVLA